MIESRFAKIILLDGSQLDFHITPEILTTNLLDMVSSYLNLKDKAYFGISYLDSTCHRNWLQLDKKVLDHDLPKKTTILVFFFRVKFFIESIALTKDKCAVELFFLQAKFSIFQNEIEITNELVYELTALVLQSMYGNFKSESEAISVLRSQNILPKSTQSSGPLKEQKIVSYYKKCASLNRGQCIVNYLSIIEKLCNYGVHYYEVKDKSNIKWYLGISFRGIGLYEYSNKVTPKKIFLWSKLENLYYRDRKFSIEVHESSLGQLRESQQDNELELVEESFNPVKVYAWFASIPSLCKSIWLMAVSQHQFYLDKKQHKDVLLQYKSLNDLALELSAENKSAPSGEAFEDMILSDEAYSEKTQMLMLLKKKQEILMNKLNIKKTYFNKIKSKQQDIIEFAKIGSEDKACIYNIMSLIKDLKYTVSESQQNQYSLQVFTDEETEVQRKIMLMALDLASNPSATHLKARRDFYERAKKKFAKLENSKENSEYYETFQSAETSSDHPYPHNNNNSSIASRAESIDSDSGSRIQTKLSHYFNENVVVDLLDSVSPASIHRKDSYRRAQEHKLFLENSRNVAKARPINGKRVKNILNESKSSMQYNNLSNLSARPAEMNFIESSHTDRSAMNQSTQSVSSCIGNGFSQRVFANNLYDVKSFKDEEVMLLASSVAGGNNKAKSISPKELIGFDICNLDSEKLRIETCNSVSNFSCSEQNADIENLNNQIKNTEITIKDLPADFVTDQVRNISQRKNTSDSNVKLLADHNFYHISNTSSSSNSHRHMPINNPNITYRDIRTKTRGYDQADLFKYTNTAGAKYHRAGGLNSSSNSLVSLNESSTSPNEDLLNYTNSETNLIRSNPDINEMISSQKKQAYSPKILSPVMNNSVNCCRQNSEPVHSSLKKQEMAHNRSSFSNNGSLNLSIHTAEEFSIEMLSWLKNETNGGKNNVMINDENSREKADNATLV